MKSEIVRSRYIRAGSLLLLVTCYIGVASAFQAPAIRLERKSSFFSIRLTAGGVIRLPERRAAAAAVARMHVVSQAATSSLEANNSKAGATEPTETNSASKLRHLKDIMWVRETLEDLTAAQFACTVEAQRIDDDDGEDAVRRAKRQRKRAVDYEKLLSKLNKRIRDMGCENEGNITADFQCSLNPGVGMGSLAYTEKQRTALLERLFRTRHQLIEFIRGNKIPIDEVNDGPFIALPELPRMEIPKEATDDSNFAGPKLYVRDDGTVDWDGALQDQAALRKFGTAVWARINGRDPESVAEEENLDGTSPQQQQSPKEVTVKIVDTPEIKQAYEKLDSLSSQLMDMEKAHYQLLNSAISQGQTTANVRLAAIDPQLRSKIQQSAAELENMKVKVSFQTLVYELERIYTYLVGELGNPAINGYIPLQDRLNVAEFGLLESQIDGFNRQFMDNESVDEDVLAVVLEQLTDFKRRLGIDYYVAGFSFDREIIGRWLNELWVKTKKGLAFYVKGVQLFWNDIVFCLRLINRAAQGYTLKPREVRTIRRTFKDIITFIPFVIILLIPLSPIGHVLVFGAIQRFFPDFFPSCFTEQRQNLLQLYETAEYSELTINETWQKKLTRFSEALIYLAANASRTLYSKLRGSLRGGDKSDDTSGSGDVS